MENNSLFKALERIYRITDEQYEKVKHLKTVYISNADKNKFSSGLSVPWEGKIEEYQLTREDFRKDLDSNIYIDKITKHVPITSYKLFLTWDEAYVDMYENHQAREIEKLKRDLQELEAFTEKYKQILDDKPHLGI